MREQLVRLGRVDLAAVPGLADLAVEAVPGDTDGLAWRTRVRFAVDAEGRAGLRRHRSHDVVPVPHCPIAHPGAEALGVGTRPWRDVTALDVVSASSGERLVIAQPVLGGRVSPPPLAAEASFAVRGESGLKRLRGRTWVTEEVAYRLPSGTVRRTFRVTGAGFWQVHPGAAEALTGAVLDGAEPAPGERALDLYSGVGLFTAGLALRVGAEGAVLGVESDAHAAADARRNLHDLPQAELLTGRVERVLSGLLDGPSPLRPDVVVLDPPRAGAGRAVMTALLRRCRASSSTSPATRRPWRGTSRSLRAVGYRLASVRAFDLFPMTQHVECVAVLVPGDPS